MIAALAAVAIALALWALLGVIFADDLNHVSTMDDFSDDLDALGRVTRSAAPDHTPASPRASSHRGAGGGQP